ncbi:MAG: TraB/GumN family protein [Bacteroidales bacterium]|nr:TraB/GumN family protein [Bacteroidales bacterium]
MKKALIIFAFLAGAFSSNAQLLWKVSGNGLQKPSYLFGTHHIADQTICDGIKGFNDAYNSVEHLYGEVDTDKMNGIATQLKVMTRMKLPKGQTLSSLYTEEQMKVIDAFVTEVMGVGAKSFDSYKPVMLSSSLQVFIAMKLFPEYDAAKAIDSHMQTRAKKDKKVVKGLETIDFQLDLLYDEPIEKQAADLLEMAENAKESEEAIIKLTELYRQQDLKGLWNLMMEDTEPEEMEDLLFKRNRNWVEQMKEIMPSASAMFVVGAGHLPGEQGVIRLLEKEGYKLEPVW